MEQEDKDNISKKLKKNKKLTTVLNSCPLELDENGNILQKPDPAKSLKNKKSRKGTREKLPPKSGNYYYDSITGSFTPQANTEQPVTTIGYENALSNSKNNGNDNNDNTDLSAPNDNNYNEQEEYPEIYIQPLIQTLPFPFSGFENQNPSCSSGCCNCKCNCNCKENNNNDQASAMMNFLVPLLIGNLLQNQTPPPPEDCFCYPSYPYPYPYCCPTPEKKKKSRRKTRPVSTDCNKNEIETTIIDIQRLNECLPACQPQCDPDPTAAPVVPQISMSITTTNPNFAPTDFQTTITSCFDPEPGYADQGLNYNAGTVTTVPNIPTCSDYQQQYNQNQETRLMASVLNFPDYPNSVGLPSRKTSGSNIAFLKAKAASTIIPAPADPPPPGSLKVTISANPPPNDLANTQKPKCKPKNPVQPQPMAAPRNGYNNDKPKCKPKNTSPEIEPKNSQNQPQSNATSVQIKISQTQSQPQQNPTPETKDKPQTIPSNQIPQAVATLSVASNSPEQPILNVEISSSGPVNVTQNGPFIPAGTLSDVASVKKIFNGSPSSPKLILTANPLARRIRSETTGNNDSSSGSSSSSSSSSLPSSSSAQSVETKSPKNDGNKSAKSDEDKSTNSIKIKYLFQN